MGETMNQTEKIRGAVAEMFGKTGERFRTRDVNNSLIGREFDQGLISNALGSWAKNKYIVNGYFLEEFKEEGTRRQFLLRPVINGASVRMQAPPPPDSPDASSDEGSAIAIADPNLFTGRVMDEKPGGALLVLAADGKLYQVKPVNW